MWTGSLNQTWKEMKTICAVTEDFFPCCISCVFLSLIDIFCGV